MRPRRPTRPIPALRDLELVARPSAPWTCRVRIGSGLVDRLVRELVDEPPAAHLVVVSDDNVAPLHAEPLVERLRSAGLDVRSLSFPAGESSKTRETKAALEDELFRQEVGRDCAFLAVGGGVTGDLTGLLASTWHRGVPVIQLPTSLLAMADAALGGKTAVNLPGGKNLVGTFHQPRAIWIDVEFLATLPDERFTEGLAEIVKAAVVGDGAFFEWLEQSALPLSARHGASVEEALFRAVEIKARVVQQDERESGRRAILNFGHTIGHALEAVSHFGQTHGRAVAIGMAAESRLAVSETGFPPRQVERLDALLAALGLPVSLPPGFSTDPLIAATRRDKKARNGVARFALPREIGRMLPGDEVTVEVQEAGLREVLEELGAN